MPPGEEPSGGSADGGGMEDEEAGDDRAQGVSRAAHRGWESRRRGLATVRIRRFRLKES
jgi:hypothetical protein